MNDKPSPNPSSLSQGVPDAAQRQSSSWDISNGPRNYVTIVFLQIVSTFFSFTCLWLITQKLGPEGYGGIAAIVAASQIVQVFVNWTSFSVTRFGVVEFVETQKISRIFWVRLIVLLANMTLVLLVAPYWFPLLANWLMLSPAVFWLIIGHFGMTALWLHVQVSLQGVKLPRLNALLQAVERFLVFAGFILLIAFGEFGVGTVLTCYITVGAAMFIVGVFKLRNYIFVHFQVDKSFLKQILSYSLPLLPFALVGYFSGSYLDALFIAKFLSIKDLGIYSVAAQSSGIAMQLPMLANALLLPLFVTLQAETGHDRSKSYFVNVLPTLTLVWGIGCGLAAFMANFLIPMVFGTQFAKASMPLWILFAATVILFPIYIGYAPFANAASKTHISMYSALLAATINIAGDFILIPALGMPGSAWASILANTIWLISFSLLLRQSSGTPISWTLIAILPVILGAAIFYLLLNPWIGLLSCIFATIAVALVFRSSVAKAIPMLLKFKMLRGN